MTDKAIELMQPNTEPTAEQVALLSQDEDLRLACEDIFIAQTVLARDKTATVSQHGMAAPVVSDVPEAPVVPDVEAALVRFHERRGTPRHRSALLVRLWGIINTPVRLTAVAAVAAAILAAIFILRPTANGLQPMVNGPLDPQGRLPEQEWLKANDPEVVFHAETAALPTLRTTEGIDIPIKVVRKKGKADAVVTIGEDLFLLERQMQMTVPYGGSLYLQLPDGTEVWLHPGARLVYPTLFSGNQRKIQLTGEAYFRVAHDAARPFIVATPQGDIRDYGTEFNVETTDNNLTEVVLVEGSVGISAANGKHEMLKPGQKCSMSQARCTVEDVNTEPYESWRDGYFHFEEESLLSILTELGRFYNLSVVSYHPERLNVHMRFIIPRDRDAAYAIDMLNRMGKVSLRIDNQQIIAD